MAGPASGPGVAPASGLLGAAIEAQGRCDEAARILSEVLARRQKILGPTHPAALATQLRLAGAGQGRLGDAEQLCQDAVISRRKILGDDHPATLIARQDAIKIALRQGCYRQAEYDARRLIADQQRILGDQHPDMLTTHRDLT